MRASFFLIAVSACASDVVREDAAGHLGAVQIERVEDDCLPQRHVSTSGALFLGRTSTGRTIVVSSLDAFWGPAREDGGVLEDGSRSDFVTGADVELLIGGDPARRCGRLRYRWTDLGATDGGNALELRQSWSAVDLGCPEGSTHLPERDCGAVRRLVFTPTEACQLQCLSPSRASFSCRC